MVYFRTDRSVAELARTWNASGPYYWEIRDSDLYGDYLLARVGGYKVRVYQHQPPRYEIDVVSPPDRTTIDQGWYTALNAVFHDQLLPSVEGVEDHLPAGGGEPSSQSQRSTVRVWAADLEAGKLPEVSPLSGEIAHASRHVKYRTPPDWTPPWTAFLLVGILTGAGWILVMLLRLAVSFRVSGSIHLTAAEMANIRNRQIATYGLLLTTIVLVALSFALSGSTAAPAGLLVVLAILAFAGFIAGLALMIGRTGPRARVFQPQPGTLAVEIFDGHPVFAAAVAQMYHSPAAVGQPPQDSIKRPDASSSAASAPESRPSALSKRAMPTDGLFEHRTDWEMRAETTGMTAGYPTPDRSNLVADETEGAQCGLLAGHRPYRMENWVQGDNVFLTIFFSDLDIEAVTPEALLQLVEPVLSEPLLVRPEWRHLDEADIHRIKDAAGNRMYSLTFVVIRAGEE